MKTHNPSLLGLWCWSMTHFILWVLISSISCLLLSVVIVAWQGEVRGFAYLHALMQSDWQYLQGIGKTGLIGVIQQSVQAVPDQIEWQARQHIVLMLLPYLNALLLGLKLLMVRLFFLLHWGVLTLLLGVVALVDGLTQRSIRRAHVGRESAVMYHHAKSLIMFSIIMGVIVTLVLPVTMLTTAWVMLSAILLSTLAIQMTAKQFKKYI